MLSKKTLIDILTCFRLFCYHSFLSSMFVAFAVLNFTVIYFYFTLLVYALTDKCGDVLARLTHMVPIEYYLWGGAIAFMSSALPSLIACLKK